MQLKRTNYQTIGHRFSDFFIGLAFTYGLLQFSFVFAILLYVFALLRIGNIYMLLGMVLPYSMGAIIIGLLIYLGITRYWTAFGLLAGLVGLYLYIWWNLHLVAPWSF